MVYFKSCKTEVRERGTPVCAREVNVEKWEGLGSIKLNDRKVQY